MSHFRVDVSIECHFAGPGRRGVRRFPRTDGPVQTKLIGLGYRLDSPWNTEIDQNRHGMANFADMKFEFGI